MPKTTVPAPPGPPAPVAPGGPVVRQGLTARLSRPGIRLRRMSLPARISLAALLLLSLAALLAPWITPHDPLASGTPALGPSGDHWFGTDLAGCDYYAHVVHGARPTLLIGVAVTLFALAIALAFGLLAGYYGGLLDALIARLTDVFFGLPFVLGATVILVAFPSHGVWAMTLVLVLLGWTTMIRIMRGQVISVRDADYVQAARLLGASDARIMARHILPNAIAPVIVVATLNVGNVIVGEATLDFLGVGLQYPEVSWGLQLNQAKDAFIDHPHLLVFPAVFLSATVLSFLMLGDAARDALDPKLR